MKKIFLYIAAVATLSTTACSDFLEIEPVGAVSESAFLSQGGVNQLISGMYGRVLYTRDGFGSSYTNYEYGDVLGGQANKGSEDADQPDFASLEKYQFSLDNSYLETKWNSVYDGPYRAHIVMSTANKIQDELSAIAGVSKDFYTEAIAQARFIRGLSMFEGIKLFGAAIPYITLEDFEAAVSPIVSNVDESGNYIYIWDKVIEDLQYAYDNLPETWPAAESGRPNKWAAAGILAKVKLYKSSPYDGKNATAANWAEVKTLLETIMANGVDGRGTKYKLANNYQTLWDAATGDWTGESVFDIQNVVAGTQTTTNSIFSSAVAAIGLSGNLGAGGWGFYQPSSEMVQSFIVDNSGLPLLDKSYRNLPTVTELSQVWTGKYDEETGERVMKDTLVTDLTVYTDPRVDVTLGRFNIPYLDWAIPMDVSGWLREPGSAGYYLNKKPQPKKADNGSLSVATGASSTAKNFHVLRYADILLMYAECLIETGDLEGAREYINQVRARAANYYVEHRNLNMEFTPSNFVLEDLVNGTTKADAAANYRIGLYPASLFTSRESAHKVLRMERALELSMEGHRWYDLTRWGIVVDEINEYINYEKTIIPRHANSIYSSTWYTMPIPYNQIIKMEGALVQDQRWK